MESFCAWSQKPRELISADLAVVGYPTGVKEYYLNNELSLGYKNYKILFLGFNNTILYQTKIDSCVAGKFFPLTYLDLGQNDIFSLKIMITQKSFWEKIWGVKPYPKNSKIFKNKPLVIK